LKPKINVRDQMCCLAYNFFVNFVKFIFTKLLFNLSGVISVKYFISVI
jgi:hypothetical protein